MEPTKAQRTALRQIQRLGLMPKADFRRKFSGRTEYALRQRRWIVEKWDGWVLTGAGTIALKPQPKPQELTGAQIKKVVGRVIKKYKGIKIGPYKRFKKEDGSWSFEEKGPYASTKVITFGNIVAGDFYAIQMEDEWRGREWDLRDAKTEKRLEEWLHKVVRASSGWIGERNLLSTRKAFQSTAAKQKLFRNHTTVKRVGAKYRLLVGRHVAGEFSTWGEAEGLSDALNKMTLAEARKTAGV